MKVPRREMTYQHPETGKTLSLPWIAPSSWVAYLMDRYPVLLCGVKDGISNQLECFWKSYQAIHPGHIIFRDPSKLHRSIPLILHGDEGRYLKRSNFMVCSVESILGSHPETKKSCHCREDEALRRYDDLHLELGREVREVVSVALKQNTNTKGHSYLSRFLSFGLASKHYKENPGLLEQLFALVSQDLTALCEDGVMVKGERIYAGFLGVKGDLKFHTQVGCLSRSYQNLGAVKNRPMCHLCLAGSDNVPFESLEDNPEWLATSHREEPWPPTSPPALVTIPYDNLCRADIFKLDLFHCWKVGQGRDLCGSSIVVLARLGKFDFEPQAPKNLEDRLIRVFSCFKLWCETTHHTMAMRSFSKNNLMVQDMKSFPWGNFKGSDTMLVSRWLLFFVTSHMTEAANDPTRLFSAMTQTLQSTVRFFDELYKHGLWLRRPCGQRLQYYLLRMVRGYNVLALECHNLGLAAYGLKPKLHAIHHICHEMAMQLRTKAPLILSPLAFNTEMNEDLVGRVSRLARKVSSRTVNRRVFDRLLIKTKALVRKKFHKT